MTTNRPDQITSTSRRATGLRLAMSVALALTTILVAAPPAAQAQAAINPLKIVVIGDSYAAGNGGRAADGGDNYAGPDGCFRSPTNWSSQYADWLTTQGYQVTYVNRACSGGVTADYTARREIGTKVAVVYTAEATSESEVVRRALAETCRTDFLGDETYTADYSFYDYVSGAHYVTCTRWMLPQINAIGKDTDLVIMTGGGNDVDFSKIIEQCFAPFFRDPGSCREKVGEGRAGLDLVEDRLVDAFATVRSRARPDTKIAFVGYPFLANNDDFELVYKNFFGFETDRYAAALEVRALGRIGDERQSSAVDRANAAAGEDFVSYVNIKDLFTGHEPKPELGTGNPDRWIAEFEGWPKDEFFHYNAEGHRQLGMHLRQFETFGATGLGTGTFGSVDLAFVIDTTGSMGSDIAAVKASANAVIDRLEAGTQSYRVAVVDYRDFPSRTGDSDDYASQLVLDFSTDPAAIRAAIDSLSLGYGGDFPETMWSGLMEAFSLDWRPGVKKVALQFGDAPALDPEPFTGYTTATVIEESLRVDPVAVYAIDTGSAGNAIRQVAAATGGQVFVAPSPSQVADQITAVLEAAFGVPYAWVGTVYHGRIGEPFTFNGTGSYDPDGEIVSWEWDVDGDGVFDTSTPGPTLVHTYTTDYDGRVTLKVTDNEGAIGLATAPVHASVDGDRVPDDVDNCPVDWNPLQEDEDANGVGDACDPNWTVPTEDQDGVGFAVGPPPTSTIIDGPFAGSVGESISIEGEVSDPEGDVVTSTWFTEADCVFGDTNALATTISCSEEGDHPLWLVADDGNGGIVAAETLVSVTAPVYVFGGFEPPVRSPGVTVLRPGRTLPVKWTLSDAGGAPVDDPSSFVGLSYELVDCVTGESDGSSAAESRSGLRANGDGGWHYNWKTPNDVSGQCAIVTLTLDDGAARTFVVQFN